MPSTSAEACTQLGEPGHFIPRLGTKAANRATLRTMFMFEAGTGDWEVCERCLEQESCTEKSLE